MKTKTLKLSGNMIVVPIDRTTGDAVVERDEILTAENVGALLESHRWCYFIPPQTGEGGGFIPALVIEGVQGYRMMSGQGRCAEPWYWGNTEDKANAVCDDVNLRRGITKADQTKIVLSTMPGNFDLCT